MAKSKYIYTCNQCGYETSKWNGKCPSCGAWNSLEEELADKPAALSRSSYAAVDLSDQILELENIGAGSDVRYKTGLGELDRVLGGDGHVFLDDAALNIVLIEGLGRPAEHGLVVIGDADDGIGGLFARF